MVTCTDAVKEAVTNLGGVVSTRKVIDYVYERYPDRPWKENSIQCHLIGLSVNHPSSRHYPTQRRQACLFWLGRGRYRLYDPERDGMWVVDDKGVHLVSEETLKDVEDEDLSRHKELIKDSEIERCLEFLNLPQRSEILLLLRNPEHNLDLKAGFVTIRQFAEGVVQNLAEGHNIVFLSRDRYSLHGKIRRLREEDVLSHPVAVDLDDLWERTSLYLHSEGLDIPQRRRVRDFRDCIEKMRDIIFSLCEAQK